MFTVGERRALLLFTILCTNTVEGRSAKCEHLIKEKLGKYYDEKINNDVSIKEYLAHGNKDQSKCQYLEKELRDICNPSTYGCGHTKTKARKRDTPQSSQVGRTRRTVLNGGRITNPDSSIKLDHKKRSYYSNVHLEYLCYPRFDCSSASTDLYRRYDGSCNNLYQYGWEWGSADRIQSGYLWADYDDDYGKPRTKGGNLPNPRLISKIVHTATVPQEDDPERSLFCMQFGQLLAHDMVLTEQFINPDGTSLDCCGADMSHAECFPITVQQNDGHFQTGECFNFVRSRARLNCANGIREQVNEQTSFLDLSMVYGVSDAEATSLRTLSGGLLKTVLNKLPKGPDEQCELSRPSDAQTYYCTEAGDPRSDEQPGLASIHTIWAREHNRLAAQLATNHPSWTDEKVFQEARKINIAEWQHIVYNEYLPVTIGMATMQAYNIHIDATGHKDTYDISTDPTIRNAFGAAIFRFGHTLVSDKIALANLGDETILNEEDLKFNFFEPELYHSNANDATDNILKWTAATPCLLSDRKLQASIQKFLFLDALNKSADLATLNIQRGRDHGVPSYNEFRAYCNLPRAFNFGVGGDGFVDHDQDVVTLLSNAYMYPDDVDLFTGYISERRISDSQLGPTGQCLFALQFLALRNGDRFFYERNDPLIAFTQGQLMEIKEVRMSTVFCLNTAAHTGKRVQLNMFRQEEAGNPFVDCNNVQGIDLTLW